MSERYVLSVDDSFVIRKLMSKPVEALELSLLEANDGNEALDLVSRYGQFIKLILLDWNMPGMSGIEFLEIIKKDNIHNKIPVVMVTTEAEKENVIKAIQLGAVGYLIKPFSNEDLTKKITQFVRGSQP